ncbi:MAG TPA: hypothetical protein VMF51_10350 [Nocardioides sp.]|uniref:hypothetical protein n=1 Tax=Nocardioides sp. TaxID=35761 RepID=UPI002D0A2809|nr:hypothetical protein [Nocardioides sp.]HTW15520.1 hypothetical protein [Nocardioides sp.]
MRVSAAMPAVLIALTLASPAYATESSPGAKVEKVTVSSTKITGRKEPVNVAVSLTGDGPFTWSGVLSYRAASDVLVSTEIVGPTDLPTGASVITVSDTAVLSYPGVSRFTMTVKDARGATTSAETTITTLSRTTRPRVTGVGKHRSKPGKRVVWGKASRDLPSNRYRVYLRPAGKKAYRAIGTVHGAPNGTWRLVSRKIRPGTVYVVTDSEFVRNRRSKTFRITARALVNRAKIS